MTLTILVAIIGAVIGAFATVLLTRLIGPDYRQELSTLNRRVDSLQEQIRATEQERAELEHLPLSMTLQQAVLQNYSLLVKNNSDKEITVETVTVRKGELNLCEPSGPRGTEDWTIPAHEGKVLNFAPQPDPGTKLRMINPQLSDGELTEIQFVLRCRVSGRPVVSRKTFSVTVSRSGGWITAY